MKKIYLITIIAILEIYLVSFTYHNEWLVLFVTGALAFALLAVFKFNNFYLKSFILFGVLGSAAEFLPVKMGAWSYETSSALGLPAYLPLLWGSAGVVIIYGANKFFSHDK